MNVNNQFKTKMLQLGILVKRDLTHSIFSYKPVVIFVLAQVIDLYLFVLLYSQLIGEEYFYFASIGVLSLYLYVNSARTGADHNRERVRGFDVYLSYLPVSRATIIVGKLLAGVIAGNVYNAFFLLTLVLFVGLQISFFQLMIIVIASSLLALFAASFSLVLAELIRVPRHYTRVSSFIYSYVLFFSTVFYPENAFPIRALSFIVTINPISACASIIRESLSTTTMTTLVEPFILLASFVLMVITSLFFITLMTARRKKS